MAILAALQSASIRLMGNRPSVFFGAGGKFEMEITDLANEISADVRKSHDWQAITKIATLAGDGAAKEFALPADYDRQLLISDMQDATSWAWGYDRIADINEFMFLDMRDFGITPGAWALYGNALHFTPAPRGNAVFPYISNLSVRDSAAAMKREFTADSDSWLLPERLLTLGVVWRWRENKKLDFTGDQEAFMKAISEYAGKDAGSRVYRRNGRRRFGNTHMAWPYALGDA